MNAEKIQRLLDELGPNTLVVIADATNAQGFLKIRGLDAYDVGILYGAATHAIRVNLEGFAQQVERQQPVGGLELLTAGVQYGKDPDNHKGAMKVTDRRYEGGGK